MLIKNNTTDQILVIRDMTSNSQSQLGLTLAPQAQVAVSDVEAGESKDLKVYVDAGLVVILSQSETDVLGIATDAQAVIDVTAGVSAHATLATGIHGVGASTVESVSGSAGKVSTHAGLTTGVHGVGAGTIAKVADIASDTNLSANAQDAVSKRHDGTLQVAKADLASGRATVTAVGGVSSAIALTGWGTTYKVVASIVSGPATAVVAIVTQSSASFTITIATDATGATPVDCSSVNAIVNWIAIKDTL